MGKRERWETEGQVLEQEQEQEQGQEQGDEAEE